MDALASSSGTLFVPAMAPETTKNDTLKIDKLPAVVFYDMLAFFKYEELADCRLVNHFFKRSVEKRLNDAFMRLGRELGDLALTLKRRLPRKESERKDHPLNRYSEIISAMETRYTLLSMTYKKYMDAGLSCFVPGKVLDLSFNVLNMIRDYVKRDVYVQLNAIAVMRDIRDYSTMATEHFDLYVVPLLNKRLQDPGFIRRSLEGGGRYFAPTMRTTTSLMPNAYNFSLPSPFEFDSDYLWSRHAVMNKYMEQMNAQSKQLEDMRKLLNAQKNAITNINEVTKHISPSLSSAFSIALQRMNNSSANLQEMLNTSTATSSFKLAHESTFEWLSKHTNKRDVSKALTLIVDPSSRSPSKAVPSVASLSTANTTTKPSTLNYWLRSRRDSHSTSEFSPSKAVNSKRRNAPKRKNGSSKRTRKN